MVSFNIIYLTAVPRGFANPATSTREDPWPLFPLLK
jgi:hypothetical protein